jgi:hypothetical protein
VLGSLSTLSYLFDLVEFLARRAPGRGGEGLQMRGGGSELFHRLGLRPFGALGDRKLHLVALIERLEA